MNYWIMQKNWEDLGQIFQIDHDQNFISQQTSKIMVHMPEPCEIMIDILSSGAGCHFVGQSHILSSYIHCLIASVSINSSSI